MASGSGWNLWVWLLGVVARRYIDFLILLIPPTPLVSVLFCSSIPTFCSFKKKKYIYIYIYIYTSMYIYTTACIPLHVCIYIYLPLHVYIHHSIFYYFMSKSKQTSHIYHIHM